MATTLSKTKLPGIVKKIKPDVLVKKVQPVVKAAVKDFGQRAVWEINSDAVFKPSRLVSQYLTTNTQRLAGINRTTQKSIMRVLEQGVEAGRSVDELAGDLEDAFDRMSAGRAYSIARTTVTQASNFAATEGYRQVGVGEKEWLTTAGGDARETHQEMDGQIRDIEEDFDSPAGGSAPYPGAFDDPSEDANCRCGVLPVVSEKGYRARDRVLRFKILERQRKTYDRSMRIAFGRSFEVQKRVAISALRAA
jgi:uncharacterized protein with gpF-like domain